MAEKVIRLFCAAGMSTSLLVNKMKEAAKAQGKDYDALGKLQAAHPDKAISDIPMQMYGLMDGKGTLARAEELMKKGK